MGRDVEQGSGRGEASEFAQDFRRIVFRRRGAGEGAKSGEENRG